VIKIRSRCLSARNPGPRRKKPGQRVDSWKTEGLFNKKTKRRGIRRSRPSDHRSTTEITSAGERAGARVRNDRRAKAISDLWPIGRADWPGPEAGVRGTGWSEAIRSRANNQDQA
jgi:hypothetical protein